jgi:hypothetical protein
LSAGLVADQFLSAEDVVVVLGEAVGFVADELKEFEPGGGAGELQFLRLAQAAYDLFLLGEGKEERAFARRRASARRLDLSARVLQGSLRSVQLAGAAIDEEDVRADAPFFLDAAEVSADHLMNHGQVVLPGHRLDAEPAVARFEGLPVDEGDE